ncbi:MAG: DUF2786 domain-containing protein [Candidatus Nanopelagicales bacterium]|nr:DUF2786 domain-containing protein [Candidatus Nanopelagicales bacterium]
MFTHADSVRGLLYELRRAHHCRDAELTDAGIRALAGMPAAVVEREVEGILLGRVDSLWSAGWQPAELRRQARNGCATAASARLIGIAIAVDHARRRAASLDSRWIAQVDSLGLPVVNARAGWVRGWVRDEGLDWADALRRFTDVLGNVLHLPQLDPVLPRPGIAGGPPRVAGAARPGRAAGAGTNPRLERIRGLLAKAESSTFEAEAAAFTAKAQEMMTRHAIDAALVHGQSAPDRQQPVAVRVPIDAPYADAKSLLLQTVAHAGRCRSFAMDGLAMSTVVGYPDDVDGVEMLFTSLLLQAQSALADDAKHAPAGTRTRSQSYRSAFLLAYTTRIGIRLDEINDAVYAQVNAEKGSAFLPVLRSRSEAVDDYVSRQYGDLTDSHVRGGYDAAGWASGHAAGQNAQLNSGDLAATGT